GCQRGVAPGAPNPDLEEVPAPVDRAGAHSAGLTTGTRADRSEVIRIGYEAPAAPLSRPEVLPTALPPSSGDTGAAGIRSQLPRPMPAGMARPASPSVAALVAGPSDYGAHDVRP